MKVQYNNIPGELLTLSDCALFVPDHEPYGANRLTIYNPVISIAGKDDEDCIWIRGNVKYEGIKLAESRSLREHGDWSFYPIPR